MEDNQQPSSQFKELKEDNDYLIYSDGRLFSKKTGRFLTGKIDNVGYHVYSLAIGNKLSVSGRKLGKMVYAHRLVAEYFLENPNNLPYVHHRDENKLNNDVSNLEWVSSSENYLDHLKKHGRPKIKAKYFETNLENEQWMVFPENEQYSISSCGRVRNNNTNRLLKIDDSQTYSRVSLNDRKHYYIHRMVYCTFNNDFDLNGYVIDHIDSNPKNNNLSNLQKITQQNNCLKEKRFND